MVVVSIIARLLAREKADGDGSTANKEFPVIK